MPIPPTSQEQMLGGYRLLRVLGEGGMGTVYLALDEALRRQVAVKVLRGSDGSREPVPAGTARRFMREAQSAAKLNHPHVVTIYAVGQQAGRPFIVMEYVEGGSLAQRLRAGGPLHWRDAARAMRNALRGLAAAHRAGIVHRDVKPANLMLAHDEQGAEVIKLADFGLARLALETGDGELTFPGAFVGSPSYSAPEQIAGVARLDGRADLYSLAATAFALLTGQPPFVAEDPAEVMEKHLKAAFPEVRALAPTVPAEFSGVLARAGAKRPADRYRGAAEMLRAVERLLLLPGEMPGAARARGGKGSMPEQVVARTARGRRTAGSRPARSAGDGHSPAEQTVVELESRLASARRHSDSTTQLSTLRTLYGLYAQLDRPEDARRAFREALVLHVKMQAPGVN